MRQYRVGRVTDIPIRMDVSVVVVSVVVATMVAMVAADWAEVVNLSTGTRLDTDVFASGIVPWLLGVVTAILLLGCVLCHELGHCLVARQYGHPVESITFWLFGGAARIQTTTATWRQEVAIALAGPAASSLAGLCAMGFFLAVAPGGTVFADSVLFVLGYLVVMNLGLAVFNMIPVVPADGGQAIRAVLSRSRSHSAASRLTAAISVGLAGTLALAGVALSLYALVVVALMMTVAVLVEAAV
jgi:Zn-dependent protease